MVFEKLNTVLCINDNDITLFILKRALSKANFAEKITQKKDGLEALIYCQELIKQNAHVSGNYPKVIFLDLHMPIMDGWEFLDKFATDIQPFFKDTKIIITSQTVDSRDCIRAKEHPFVADFIKQPITIESLIKLHESLTESV